MNLLDKFFPCRKGHLPLTPKETPWAIYHFCNRCERVIFEEKKCVHCGKVHIPGEHI